MPAKSTQCIFPQLYFAVRGVKRCLVADCKYSNIRKQTNRVYVYDTFESRIEGICWVKWAWNGPGVAHWSGPRSEIGRCVYSGSSSNGHGMTVRHLHTVVNDRRTAVNTVITVCLSVAHLGNERHHIRPVTNFPCCTFYRCRSPTASHVMSSVAYLLTPRT